MGTLADLVQGFQGGYTGVQEGRRRRKFNQAIDYELEGMSQRREAGNAGIRRLYGENSGMEAPNFEMPQTFGEKLVTKFRGMFGGGSNQIGNSAINPAEQTYEPSAPLKPARFRDGGAVRTFKRSALPMADGGMPDRLTQIAKEQKRIEKARLAAERKANPSLTRRAATGARKVANKAGRVAAPIALGATAIDVAGTGTEDYRERFGIPYERGGDIDEAAASYEEPSIGGFLKEIVTGGEAGGDMLARTAGAASDLGSAMTFGQAGKLYRDQRPAGTSAPVSDKAAAVTAAVNADEPMGPPETAAQPAGDPPNTGTPQARAAAQPGGPPDEIIDFTQVRDVMPEDMPNHGVKDWEDERRFWAAQAIAMGNDPFEAMKAVDARQMRGFQQYSQQAFQMLQAGDATGAARALYAAYQYFPNGANVRFGVHKGVDGQPVLVGMGTDEKTGEPMKGGKPMIINAERLSVMTEQLSNPAAFRTWTKDWRDTEQEIREWNEVTKKEAESTAIYRDRMGRAALNNSVANMAGASGRGGVSASTRLAAQQDFRDAMGLFGMTPGSEDAKAAKFLTSVMEQLYDAGYKGGGTNTIINDVFANSEDGTNVAALIPWLESLGLED